MSETFSVKQLQFQFTLGGGSTVSSLDSFGSNGAQLPSNLRASVTITNAGGLTMQTLDARIWGMTKAVMNGFTTLGKPIWKGNSLNKITVSAGDANGMATIFDGVIQQAWAAPESPDVPFVVNAYAGLDSAMTKVPPTSQNGSIDAATLIQGMAQNAGYQFQNYGVSGAQISNPYYGGTYWQQMQAVAQHAHIAIGLENNIISIWPLQGNKGTSAVVIDSNHGMVGYPVWTANGLVVTTLFNPNIELGGQIQLTSQTITPANGTWGVIKVDHELETQLPGGKWFTRVECTLPGVTAVGSGS